jgi:hypothetical protein
VSNVYWMIQDARRYVPSLTTARYVRSLYEIKTILPQNEHNDGRPILFRLDHGLPGHSIVLGGKIDNIYDIVARMPSFGLVESEAARVALFREALHGTGCASG